MPKMQIIRIILILKYTFTISFQLCASKGGSFLSESEDKCPIAFLIYIAFFPHYFKFFLLLVVSFFWFKGLNSSLVLSVNYLSPFICAAPHTFVLQVLELLLCSPSLFSQVLQTPLCQPPFLPCFSKFFSLNLPASEVSIIDPGLSQGPPRSSDCSCCPFSQLTTESFAIYKPPGHQIAFIPWVQNYLLLH